MSQSREELQRLIDSLSDDQVEQVLADVRRRTGPKRAPSEQAFAWVGSATANNGRSDNATNIDALLDGWLSRRPPVLDGHTAENPMNTNGDKTRR